ncbi:hypothetical protein HPP92_004917 [Vanilla planifolia]|uniref:Uncharacterized protein n=1 Tax=Vanilla planifolia TaxID=51239 RepID=A0A835RLZ9_VANPL|nr:hypothetical protein HPP92_004917 [Vanilla planifolia]
MMSTKDVQTALGVNSDDEPTNNGAERCCLPSMGQTSEVDVWLTIGCPVAVVSWNGIDGFRGEQAKTFA